MATRTILSILIFALAAACRSTGSMVATPGAAAASAASPAISNNTGLVGSYDSNNPFARIIRGELPASKVHEDEHVLALMPLRMISRGHVLVISKTSRARNILEIEPEELARVMNVATRVARAQIAALGIQGFQILQNNGAVGTQSVFHLHVHVIPRYAGVELLPAAGPNDDRRLLDDMARTIKAAMK